VTTKNGAIPKSQKSRRELNPDKMNLTAKTLKFLSRIFIGLTIVLLGIALFYIRRNDNGPSGVLPALLAMPLPIIALFLNNAAKIKKDEESKGT
jgi:hypothetical protein